MSSQNRKDPFHVNRDVVRDNLSVTRKIRLPKRGEIRVRILLPNHLQRVPSRRRSRLFR